jgi:hypothetical protein
VWRLAPSRTRQETTRAVCVTCRVVYALLRSEAGYRIGEVIERKPPICSSN